MTEAELKLRRLKVKYIIWTVTLRNITTQETKEMTYVTYRDYNPRLDKEQPRDIAVGVARKEAEGIFRGSRPEEIEIKIESETPSTAQTIIDKYRLSNGKWLRICPRCGATYETAAVPVRFSSQDTLICTECATYQLASAAVEWLSTIGVLPLGLNKLDPLKNGYVAPKRQGDR